MMSLKSLDNMIVAWLGGDSTLALVVQVFVVVLLVVVANALIRLALTQLAKRAEATETFWDNALVDAAKRPVTLAGWIVGLAFAARIIEARTDAAIFEAIVPVRTVGVIFCIAWFLVGFIANAQNYFIEQRKAKGEPVDHTTVEAIGKLLRLSVIITAVLMALQSLGVSISGLLAFGGIGGIAVGFAAKDLLANFFGGLMVYLDRPFSVGDWIRSPEKEIEGVVEYIGWRLTRIRTFDKRPLYVPNAVFTQITVENPSRMTNRRIYETVGVRYDDVGKVAGIVEDIKAMLRTHPEIDQKQVLIVNLVSFGASSLDIMVYTLTKTTAWVHFHEVKQDVMLKVADIVAAHGAEIAFPTRTLHLIPDEQAIAAMSQSFGGAS